MKNKGGSCQHLRLPFDPPSECQQTFGRNWKQVNHTRIQNYPLQKQNNIRNTNIAHDTSEKVHKHIKSTASTKQTHLNSSTDNLHIHRLESVILQLQKTLDQQQFELQTLESETNYFMKHCQQQKQVLMQLNIQGMKSQYEQQIQQLIQQRQKMQQIVAQLQQDYNQVYMKQQNSLQQLSSSNMEVSMVIEHELQKKKYKLDLLTSKDQQLADLQIEYRKCEQKLDQLRNIQRKLNIALIDLQMIKRKEEITITLNQTIKMEQSQMVFPTEYGLHSQIKQKQVSDESSKSNISQSQKNRRLYSTQIP